MTPVELIETLELHAQSQVADIMPSDCAEWARVVREALAARGRWSTLYDDAMNQVNVLYARIAELEAQLKQVDERNTWLSEQLEECREAECERCEERTQIAVKIGTKQALGEPGQGVSWSTTPGHSWSPDSGHGEDYE